MFLKMQERKMCDVMQTSREKKKTKRRCKTKEKTLTRNSRAHRDEAEERQMGEEQHNIYVPHLPPPEATTLRTNAQHGNKN